LTITTWAFNVQCSAITKLDSYTPHCLQVDKCCCLLSSQIMICVTFKFITAY